MKILLRLNAPHHPRGRGDAHGYDGYGDGCFDGISDGDGKGYGYNGNRGHGSGHGGFFNGDGGIKESPSYVLILGYRSTI